MSIADNVRPGANRYISEPQLLHELPSYLEPYTTIAVVTGEASLDAFLAYYPHPFDYRIVRYDGSASYEDGDRLAHELEQADVILGLGGGRVLDTAKMVAENLGADLILVPTLISNCGPYTPIAAVYHPDRSFRQIGYFQKAATLTLVDTAFLLQTPTDYFVAGIGDTLAKWYEIDGIVRHLSEDQKTAYIRLGVESARLIKEILVADAEQAVADLEANRLSPAYTRITDTIIALAGEVGGFAATYGRSAGAHAIHDGFSYLHETHDMLHGKKVAYGILVQLAYTQELDTISELLPFYQAIGLPTRLADVNIQDTSAQYLAPVTEHAASEAETFRFVDPEVTAAKITAAIQVVETFNETPVS